MIAIDEGEGDTCLHEPNRIHGSHLRRPRRSAGCAGDGPGRPQPDGRYPVVSSQLAAHPVAGPQSRGYANLPGARSSSLTVSAIATATSTALDAVRLGRRVPIGYPRSDQGRAGAGTIQHTVPSELDSARPATAGPPGCPGAGPGGDPGARSRPEGGRADSIDATPAEPSPSVRARDRHDGRRHALALAAAR
jgi:hypothetical protein